MNIDSKRIAKNTIYLYLRFICILLVNLFASRIILNELGVSDFGMYNTVYSIVGFMTFLNSTLSASTSRFITYELGSGDNKKLNITFGTTWFAHILLSILILFLGETIGLFYIHNIMIIPQERITEAFFIYQISIVSTIVSILQVPFTSTIIAHESMSAYTYVGIYEAVAKLTVAVILTIELDNKLITYSFLTLMVSLSVFLSYFMYARIKFKEITFALKYDVSILKRILRFSGWNIMANVSNVLSTNVIILLFNLFFSPVVVAAHTISTQVYSGLYQITYNVRAAVNPQIIKLYADGNYIQSRRLTISSSELLFDISMITCMPIIVISNCLLKIWLGEVPEYAVSFTQLFLLQVILDTFNSSYYTPMLASNKISKNSILGLFLNVIQVVVLYILFSTGFDPMWARYMGIIVTIILSWIVKPYILCRDINYPLEEMRMSIFMCTKKLIVVIAFNVSLYYFIPQNNIITIVSIGILSFLITTLVVIILMPKYKKQYLKSIISKKIIR